jgi:hypothetical protein
MHGLSSGIDLSTLKIGARSDLDHIAVISRVDRELDVAVRTPTVEAYGDGLGRGRAKGEKNDDECNDVSGHLRLKS